uniref:Secreted protein n=1 Tax=Panagrolaimus sp. JU765 TaxID=591449 RepID=A0AC34QM79_9BILA
MLVQSLMILTCLAFFGKAASKFDEKSKSPDYGNPLTDKQIPGILGEHFRFRAAGDRGNHGQQRRQVPSDGSDHAKMDGRHAQVQRHPGFSESCPIPDFQLHLEPGSDRG